MQAELLMSLLYKWYNHIRGERKKKNSITIKSTALKMLITQLPQVRKETVLKVLKVHNAVLGREF